MENRFSMYVFLTLHQYYRLINKMDVQWFETATEAVRAFFRRFYFAVEKNRLRGKFNFCNSYIFGRFIYCLIYRIFVCMQNDAFKKAMNGRIHFRSFRRGFILFSSSETLLNPRFFNI